MSELRRVVLDTSTLASAALQVGSIAHQALLKALGSCELCASSATLSELEQVLKRDKFDRYLDTETRLSCDPGFRDPGFRFSLPAFPL